MMGAPEEDKICTSHGGHYHVRWEILNPKIAKNVLVFFNEDAFSDKSRVGTK